MLAHALRYAGGGINVFPVNGDKEPLTGKGGFHHATTDRAQIEEWWTRHPSAGVATPDFDVVDVDLYKVECKPTWTQIKPLIPKGTPQNRTGRGGLQFFFQAGTLRRGKIGPGVDCRYAGSNYVLLPPSRNEGGGYETIVDLLTRKPKPAPDFPLDANGGGTAAEIHKLIATGGKRITDDRNASTFWYAVGLLETEPELDRSAAELRVQAWVDIRCAGDLSEVDVRKQVRGAAKWVAEHGHKSDARTDRPHLEFVQLSQVEMRSISFLDKPLLQRAAFHLVAGRKGVGKGTVIAAWASAITRGGLGEKRKVIWIGSEDSAAIDIRPRVEAAGGDPSKILVVSDGWLQLPRDLDEIQRAAVDFGDTGLIVIDPVGNHLTGKNSNGETDIRDAIAPLNGLADSLDSMVFGVRHLSEKECSHGALAAILGSSAWVQVPRAIIAVVRDSEDVTVSHIQCIAGNRLPPDTPGRMYRIEGVLLPGLENEVAKAVWLGDSTRDVETLLSASNDKPNSKSAQARELLLDILDDEGRQESDALDARVARETGLAAKTVRNLRIGLGKEGLISSSPDRDENGVPTRWNVSRTHAPRGPGRDLAPLDHDSENVNDENGLPRPDPSHVPNTQKSLSRESEDLVEGTRSRLLGVRGSSEDERAAEGAYAPYLLTADGHCTRHPNEPKTWCLECKEARARATATASDEGLPQTSPPRPPRTPQASEGVR